MKKTLCLIICLMLLCLPCILASVSAESAPGAEQLAQQLLETQMGKTNDAWQLAILENGFQDAIMTDDALTFRLRSFDPDPASLGSYTKSTDATAWRESMLKNISAWNLLIELPLKDGQPVKNTQNNLGALVKSAANAAKKNYGKKDVYNAMCDLLFPAPATDQKVTASSLSTPSEAFCTLIDNHPEVFSTSGAAIWAPLLYARKNIAFDVKKGPHAIRLTWNAVSPETLLNTAFDNASAFLAATAVSDRPAEDTLPDLWQMKLGEAGIALMKQKLEKLSASFDILDLTEGKLPDAYASYCQRYTPEQSYELLKTGYRLMPPEASQPMPKTGKMTVSGSKGRNVTVRVDKTGRNTYVQLRDADTNVIAGDAFILPGKNVNIKVPEGTYVIQYATGSTWYGTETLFGPLGSYTASNTFEVAKQKWTLTSEAEENGIQLHTIQPSDFKPVEDRSIWIEGTLAATVPLHESYPDNPVMDGISSTTGLPASGEDYTPILMVLDNAEDAYPHWGVSEADIIFQIPNAGSGVTKLMALFADHYPEQAGPVRSGRASMLPLAKAMDAAFVYAGPPAVTGGNVDLNELIATFKMANKHKTYNMIASDSFKERLSKGKSHNLSSHIAEIHQNMVEKEAVCEERPFLFTDEKRVNGEEAEVIRVLHRGEDKKSAINSASRSTFRYDPDLGGYTRTNSSGVYIDRSNNETVVFANVIVLRVKFMWEKNYVYLNKHLTGSGCAEIFQNGRYIRGAWTRPDQDSRLVFTDDSGNELALQRGKTFIVVTNDVTDVVYSPL